MLDQAPRVGDWMQTASGRMFWPMDPRPSEVTLYDIAHSLAMQCRYAGHCQRFYSVAEHSVLVSKHVPKENALWGLLHDASEAYLVDVPRPVKPFLPGYKEAEERVMAAVAERFGLSPEMPDSVKEADNRILIDEMRAIMQKPPQPWNISGAPLNVSFMFWEPHIARQAFLERFSEIITEQYNA